MARIEERAYDRESNGAETGKALQAASAREASLFNIDYDRLLDEEQSGRAARFLEMARDLSWELVRHVMERANQTYGGSLSSGDEIGMRLLRPLDLETDPAAGVATGLLDSWQFTWAAIGAQDLFGTTGDPINTLDNSTAESMVIVAWSTNHAAPKTEAIQGTKFGRALYVQPLAWDLVAAERNNVKVIEANPWFVAFPGENFEFDTRVFVTGTDVVRAVGVFFAPGTEIRTL